ncbi:hypothetical protein, partial [Crocosphaera watsonii]|uniref:hypothetical protein n=1 Tax=Crocosphaera watsonii TaxID=263511 RepID=UPI001E64339F
QLSHLIPPESPQPTPLHPIERRNLQVGIIVSILTLIVTFCGLVFTNIWNPFKPSNNNNQNQQTQPSLTPSPTPSPSPSQP